MKGSTVLKGLTTRLKHFVDGYIFRGKIALYPSLLFTPYSPYKTSKLLA